MIAHFIAFVLIGAAAAIAYGVAIFPRKARELLVATAPKPDAEAQLVMLTKLEIAASERGDLLAAAHYAEQQEAIHGR
ncbi:hypothetical protein [Stenotrophomonas indicatrix]|uniref:hypothetical protein n=1 Tax=Stenotrophomonas indicatrix TaxID=2045451 RepID=UPI00343072F6